MILRVKISANYVAAATGQNKLLNKLSNNRVAEVGLEPTTSCTV